jgi:hypothetical protein
MFKINQLSSKIVIACLAGALFGGIFIFVMYRSHVSALDNTVTNTDNITLGIGINDLSSKLGERIDKLEATQARTKRIASLLKMLREVKSPVATEHYATMIVDLAENNGADYRILVAIMGTESGWCKADIHYNCFGYMNKVEYDSFDDAFSHLVPKISVQYARIYGWNFSALTEAYGRVKNEVQAARLRSVAVKLFR